RGDRARYFGRAFVPGFFVRMIFWMPPVLLDLLYLPAFIGFLPILAYQRLVQKKTRLGWAQRFGAVLTRSSDRPAISIHAVSLGEVNATRTLVEAIRRRLPGHDVVISTTTETGYSAACKFYGAQAVFRYPLDFSFVVSRVLRKIQPDAIVLMELE